MRQKNRRVLVFISLLLFPLTLNYFSPYISIDGAINGVVAGSVIMFMLLFISGIFLGRLWCGWLCPISGLSETLMGINNKPVNIKKLRVIRYTIFGLWFSVLVVSFVMAGGIMGVDPLRLTENYVSVDEPLKYVTYYMVVALFFVITILVGKRGACHSICWMSPFMTLGMKVGALLKIPRLMIKANSKLCTNCMTCNKNCPMSIDVNSYVKNGKIDSIDCILCYQCVDNCPKKVLK